MNPRTRFFAPVVLTFALAVTAPPFPQPAEDGPARVTNGSLRALGDDGAVVDMPLRRTEVDAEISGLLARVEVVQTFRNPFDHAIEAVYLFPLPDMAAVDEMLIEIGGRRIHGEIQRREEARRIYRRATEQGYTAALLEQERPNIFTQSVSNIEPGREISVRIRYVEQLGYDNGRYTFSFPMVVGPRHIPAARSSPTETARAVQNIVAALARVPDANRICAPSLDRETPDSHEISLSVRLDAGVTLRSVASPSHVIEVTREGARRAIVKIAESDSIPNKDFILHYDVGAEMPEVGVLAHRDLSDGFFALLLQPKGSVSEQEAAPKEIVFVLDTSGSMSGAPIDMSKRLIVDALGRLGSRDAFNIVSFASTASTFATEPLDNTPENVARAIRAVDGMRGDGGTEMLTGIAAALSQAHDPAHIRIVLFLTDGYIGNEHEILAAVKNHVGDSRIFTIGVGSSVNHYLLRRMAALGRGAYQYVRPDGNAAETMSRFYGCISRPYLTDLEIDWGRLRVVDPVPALLPDLYSGQTLAIVGRYLWRASDTVIVRGRLGGRPWEQHVEVTLPEAEERNGSLATLWARHRIDELAMGQPGFAEPGITTQIVALAMQYRLMSAFTSFVAVDDSRITNADGKAATVRQPLPVPEFVSFDGIFGGDGPQRNNAATMSDPDPSSENIEVRVFDETGQAFPGVVVTLSNVRNLQAPRSISTNAKGEAVFGAVRTGHGYVVRIEMAGYARVQEENLVVTPGRGLRLPFKLMPQMTEVMRMAAGKPLTSIGESTDTTQSTGEFFSEAPLIGHSYQSALFLAPGINDPNNDGSNAHGAHGRGFVATVDGTSNVDPLSGTFMSNIDGDTSDEIQIVTSGSDASYGQAVGGYGRVLASNPGEPAQGPDDRTAEMALRVLADIAEDGRLSPADGRPALAGLLAVQTPDGAFADGAAAHSLALWAVVEATGTKVHGLQAAERASCRDAAVRGIRRLLATRPDLRDLTTRPDMLRAPETTFATIALASASSLGFPQTPRLPNPGRMRDLIRRLLGSLNGNHTEKHLALKQAHCQ